jgi:hypothetical protein
MKRDGTSEEILEEIDVLIELVRSSRNRNGGKVRKGVLRETRKHLRRFGETQSQLDLLSAALGLTEFLREVR